ncbi:MULTISPECIES: hypothetical protein [unclassified Planococcus (in: firmicutes)]|uniref:hypothetical protein n=1 Tax=Planococcus TaxID=1372 RepID=UPI000C34C2E0|nr:MULTISPECIES: hypothetical protein [unclassified Planococcus (in: firmicutes)]AUD14814.1 hypothetical protein CW734_15515 [Planococcus sp. MB-3u-03]PKG45133.1 hypothetical protein CXF66_15060 [Planococcus sp. Urea-trap-24]PKG87475.1 hypothetical protein CXF91_15905 [Planococcus sp. Urea-3u-39]PKH42600.1 hypothetical protein CXF77_04615 [Planococcus sp. MB-3u-09]
MKRISAITPGMAAFVLGIMVFLGMGIAIAVQSYFSYVEVTEAASRCYDLGGFPEIEKSGWQMTHFECHTD